MSRRRPAVVAGLAAAWVIAIAAWAAPAATAVPASSPVAVADDAFAPVLVGRAFVAPGASAGSAIADPSVAADAPIAEPGGVAVPSSRPRVRPPAAAVRVVRKAPPPPPPAPRPATHHSLSGKASWYCKAGVSTCMAIHPDRAGVADMYAAAGPRLRRAICGSDTSNCWRGRRVVVNGVVVVLADWCQCYKGERQEKIIDLYWDAWVRVPGVENGVTIRW